MTKPFQTEAALCAAFIAAIDKRTWTPYAETEGWDILLVRKTDGFQIGIQAKLKLNAEVFCQAVREWGVLGPGPDCRAVLVPWSDASAFDVFGAYVGITVIRMHGPRSLGVYYRAEFDPDLPKNGKDWQCENWHEWCPAKRHRLPEYVPDVAAGSSAPVQLTDWKIGAIKIAVALEVRGFVTRADFKAAGIDHRRWLAPQDWLVVENGHYIAGPRLPAFKKQHPRVYAEIKADAKKWMAQIEKQESLI